jgi:hypothetical protein
MNNHISPPVWEQAAAYAEKNLDVVKEYLITDTYNIEIDDFPNSFKMKRNNSYRNNPKLKSNLCNPIYTDLQLLEWIKCSRDPIYFMTKHVWIISLDEGMIKFKLWDYQKDIINTYKNNRFCITMQSRQSGKSITAAGYILWFSIFQQDKFVAVLANKAAQAREIVQRIALMYESLPWFLQPGVKIYNKGSHEYSNNTRIESAASTNGSIRGRSCVPDYTKVCVKTNDDNEHYITISQAMELLDKNGSFKKNQILTSEGFKDFDGFITNGYVDSLLKIRCVGGIEIDCTHDHMFMLDDNSFIEARNLSIGDTLYPNIPVISIEEFDINIEVFDALNVRDTHSYVTNGVISHNCSVIYMDEFAFIPREREFYESTYPVITSGKETQAIITSTPKGARGLFYDLWQGAIKKKNEYVASLITWEKVPGRDQKWAEETRRNIPESNWRQEFCCDFLGSQNTLIPYAILSALPTDEPLDESTNDLTIIENPVDKHVYFISVDVARGVGGDYSAFVVFDITQMPFKVVAKYRSNTISTLMYPSVIFSVANHYNSADVLIEINDAGQEVAHKLYYDLEYENVMQSSKNLNKIILGGFGNTGLTIGMRTTKQTKAIGCMHLKLLVEKGTLQIRDYDIIEELTNFVVSGDSYAADEGCHDDLVMCLVLFAWASTQDYFKQNYDQDVRKRIEQETIEHEEQELMPFGFIESGNYYEKEWLLDDYVEIVDTHTRDSTF